MRTRSNTHTVCLALLATLVLGALLVSRAAADGNIDPARRYAWSTSTGWINFSPAHGGVAVYDDHLEGYVWSENVGWIRLGVHTGGGSHTYANTSNADYGVNVGVDGALSGYAWSTNAGWINFAPTHGGVRIDPASGSFSGYAWSENTGWIHFKSDTYNVIATGGSVDSGNKYAWSASTGWINFSPAHGDVAVYDDHLEGYVWSENVGWIRLGVHTGGGSHTYANTSNADYGVNVGVDGALSGYAWSTNAGWINFAPTHGGVRIDPASGSFSGYAWSENTGWIHFKSDTYNVALLLVTHTLTITTAGEGSGVVTPTVGTHAYVSGTLVILGATPHPGSSFAGWSGDVDCADGSVIMNANKICTAAFALYKLYLPLILR